MTRSGTDGEPAWRVWHDQDEPIRIGISSCLLGQKVRFDGGHKHDRYLTGVLGQWVEWVPVCPEIERPFLRVRNALELRRQHQVLAAAEAGVELELVRDEPDAAAELVGMGRPVLSVADLTFRRVPEQREQPQQGRLPRAIGAPDHGYRARFEAQVHSRECKRRPVGLRKTRDPHLFKIELHRSAL